MDRHAFADEAPGRLVPTIHGALAYVPDDLGPIIDIAAVAPAMLEAMQALGELKGACRRLAEPGILIRPLQRREALTSSAMEGTFSTQDALILAERGIERDDDDATREVRNYVRALDDAVVALGRLPICHRILTDAHRTLLSGLGHGRGAQKRPGEYKPDQNWIGGRTIDVARYVPPPPTEARACMDALERYLNRDQRPFPLLDLALVHYQFEAIHPFADGNGRVGRMLVALMAVESGLLDMPVLYVSPAMEHRKDEYIDLMFAVSTKGEWTPWIIFFLARVAESCRETIATIDRLIALQDDYRRRAGDAMRSASAITLVDHLFRQPTVTVNEAADVLGVSYQAVRKTIDRLVDLGILGIFPDAYPRLFVARGILDAANPPD
jgi:cell filamentation protein, protein adenylyltransferase